ncbi:transposase [Niabella aquatica]
METIDTVDIFIKPMYKQLIVHSLNHFIDSKGLIVYGWCLMSNRLYMICQSLETSSFKELRKSFITFTCEKIIEAIKEEHTERNTWLSKHFQQPTSYGITQTCWGDLKITSQIDMQQPQGMAEQLEFIHSIPVKERVVQYPSDYIYSSARDYEGLPGLVKITCPAIVENELYEIESRKNGFRTNYNHQSQS